MFIWSFVFVDGLYSFVGYDDQVIKRLARFQNRIFDAMQFNTQNKVKHQANPNWFS